MASKRDDTWCRSLAGKTVDKYTLVKFVGAGNMGYVYRAQHRDFPPEFERAVKLIFDELKEGWETELRKVMKLELVDGVVHLHDLGGAMMNHQGISHLAQYTVWDYIPPGENLQQYLKRVGSIPASFLRAVIERVLHVLHACDAQGVRRHGDLHSGNILIGDPSPAKLDDDMLLPRDPIYVSDFGYGTTGAVKAPKDDYEGLALIINEMLPRVNRSQANSSDRQLLEAMRLDLGKFLREPSGAERRSPLELLRVLKGIKQSIHASGQQPGRLNELAGSHVSGASASLRPSVGQFQVTEMIGEKWDWWKRLFVAAVPARSKILALDIPTVVTGPRGCGKTMLFRRLSERLVVECGEVPEMSGGGQFVAFYVNANDFADAFAHFPEKPTASDEARLTCYANLCVLADLLTVQFARTGRPDGLATEALLKQTQHWLVPEAYAMLVEGESRLGRYRAILEEIKWKFLIPDSSNIFPGYSELSQHRWLPRFLHQAREFCPWIGERSILLFVDDYSTPRVSPSMQRILNRLFLQRSPYFLAKLATEAFSTFVSEDSSGKNLEDGDDYQLVDMGEESLFLPESERLFFLNDVFSRRLESDQRIPRGDYTLRALLDNTKVSKTEFARRLRGFAGAPLRSQGNVVDGDSQRRGRSRPRVLYSGEGVFTNLWSGDTRTMIQLITDVVDQALEATPRTPENNQITIPINEALQDRVFRNRGGEWLNSHTRNAPTQQSRVNEGLMQLQRVDPNYKLCGEYGDHLKAVVEAFVAAARKLLLGPTYVMTKGGTTREVPRMAFRVEIIDDFRIDGLAREIYRDLVRYGLFIRDSRGKSVRGAFVPRLFLRRLLLPFSSLALSKRDSVQFTCESFTSFLLNPDAYKSNLTLQPSENTRDQLSMFEGTSAEAENPAYDDLDDESNDDITPSDTDDGYDGNVDDDTEEES